jgi:hypothetical protein
MGLKIWGRATTVDTTQTEDRPTTHPPPPLMCTFDMSTVAEVESVAEVSVLTEIPAIPPEVH